MTEDEKPRKRRAPRDSKGKFEAASPMTDPELMDFAIRTVRAINDLEPALAGLALSTEKGVADLVAVTGATLSILKKSLLDALAADPDSLAEAKKKVLEAKRLGNIPWEEQQRILGLVDGWMALPDAPRAALERAQQAGELPCSTDE